jgi:hypothetical protein
MGTQLSGSNKVYRTAEEASIGGVATAATFIRVRGVSVSGDVFDIGNLNAAMRGVATADGVATSSGACLDAKMNSPFASWPVACDSSLDAKSTPDMIFDLGNYRVFTKIVDTVEGNSDVSGLVTGGGELGGAGVVAANSAMINPPHIPYLYRMEIQAEANKASARERSNLSVLYGY